ncbi:class I SAM-dependent methyltransferase family protein [Natronomonas sp. F2-12]|jgi:tRNA wybutosine-synthesizing protein 2|uniref:tRNA(Phe) (4-demethylwyosine(37)-C(7)) aminocarboxypropyltransferase n=1 Tax=Natronomonas aquatica TaxID=2841590 RepID=A0A9R1D7B6_9EURY|nr:class I SAM-dependent methyltransferase family protein [Natronomonas aquatica]MCQ4334543.1 class I SAM-dependent methyltransferase family protein [Natronomonas aquatica]
MADRTDDLAAIVEKPRAETVIESLRSEGVYDETRRVEPRDGTHVAIPVTAVPDSTDVSAVRRIDLPRRSRGLEAILRERGADESVAEAAPSSWAVIGSVVLVDFGDVSAPGTLAEADRKTVGEALLTLHGNADTVLARGGIEGQRRDPSAAVVAGVGETETVHVEHGTEYAIDFAEVMFSPGNKAERARMGEVVAPGERVFDMFAGIGYFTLPTAKAGATVTAAEIDPDAYRLLVENVRRNGVTDQVRTVLGDCRGVETVADRVVAGYYDAYEYLDSALDALVSGGMLHLHEATPEPLFPDRPLDRLTDAVKAADRSLEVRDTRRVKSHSAGVVHGVVDARVE